MSEPNQTLIMQYHNRRVLLTAAARLDEFTIADLRRSARRYGLTLKDGSIRGLAFWWRVEGLTEQVEGSRPQRWRWLEDMPNPLDPTTPQTHPPHETG